MDQVKINKLVIQAQQNDQIAFAQLIAATQRFAYGSVYRMTGDAEESRDIVQEGYIRVWTNLNRYSGQATFQTWLFSILRNLSIDWLRKRKNRQSATYLQITEVDHNHPGVLLEESELYRLIRSWMLTLPETQQLVFMLRDAEDLSIKEVQEQTGLSESSIKSNLYQARQKLAVYLKKNGYPVK